LAEKSCQEELLIQNDKQGDAELALHIVILHTWPHFAMTLNKTVPKTILTKAVMTMFSWTSRQASHFSLQYHYLMISPTMKRLDVSANSPNQYHKKYMENSMENMHVDLGA